MVYSSGERDADRDLCFAGHSYISSRLDLMQRLPWNPDEIKKRRDFGGEAGADERLLDDRGFRRG